jgi:hypothetical protein
LRLFADRNLAPHFIEEASAVSTDIKPRDRLIEKHAIAGRYEGVFLPRAQFQKYSPFLNIG